jgi:hypothetical protein
MTDAQPQVQPNAPFGVEARRSRWPLLLWLVLYLVWFALLLWLATRSPAR